MTLRTAMRFGDFSKSISKPLDRRELYLKKLAPCLQEGHKKQFYTIVTKDGQPLYAQALISAGEPTIYVSVSSVKSTIMPTEAISAQCSKKFIIKIYSLPYKVVFQIIILGNFPVLTRCDPCSFFEYLHKAYLISVSAEVGYFLNGHIGGRKIILSCLDLCG